MFHLKENLKTLIGRIAAREFRRAAAFLNNFSGGPCITIDRPDEPSPTTPVLVSLDMEALKQLAPFVTLNTEQTISGHKTFSGTVEFSCAAASGGKYYHFKIGGVNAGYIHVNEHRIRLRAYAPGEDPSHSGIMLDLGGTDGAARQLLENEPSHDAGWLSSGSTQIATRGFVCDKYAAKGHEHTLGDITVSSTAQGAVMLGLAGSRLYIDTARSSLLAASATAGATKFLTDADLKANNGTVLTSADLDPDEVLTSADLMPNGGTIMTTTAGTKHTGSITVATDIQWTGTVLQYTPVTLSFNNGLCESATPGSAVTIDTPTVVAWS